MQGNNRRDPPKLIKDMKPVVNVLPVLNSPFNIFSLIMDELL